MKKLFKKPYVIILIILGCLLILWSGIEVLKRLPIGLIITIKITNNSGEDIYITPVGFTDRRKNEYFPLYNENEHFKFTLPERYNILLKSNDDLKINYSEDEFQFLIIKTKDNRYYIKNSFSPNKSKNEIHMIDDLNKLDICPKVYIPCSEGNTVIIENKGS